MAISIGKVTSSGYQKHVSNNKTGGAAEYYSGENVPSEWSGAGAKMQSLTGEVDKKDFVKVLEGDITDAKGERHMQEKTPNRLEGYDITVSAPKSVSIEALAHGNSDALDAHRQANAETLKAIEALAQARIKSGGKTHSEKTENITTATFEHHGSVAGDPHLHSHNVIANYTFDHDGNARALDARPIYSNIENLREIYDRELEKNLNEKGIQTYRDENNHVQIQGYTREGMAEFSTRQREMQARLDGTGRGESASAKERELARQETRAQQKFEPKSREQTQAEWKERAERTAGAGPFKKDANERRQEQPAEKTQMVSREEFRSAKQTVNDAKAAEQRLQTGNFRDEAHKAALEAKVQAGRDLKERNPGLYERAEKSLDKAGVRDREKETYQKIEDAAARRIEDTAALKADHDQADLNIAKWTVARAQDAKEQLTEKKDLTEGYRALLEARVSKAEQLQKQDPDLYAKAEKAWKNEQDKDEGRQGRTDKQAEQPGMQTRAGTQESRQGRTGKQEGKSDAGSFKTSKTGGKQDFNTLRDADLAARALKSDSGLFFGIGRKTLSAKDRQEAKTVFNSKGDKFYITKSGDVYAAGLHGKEPSTFFKKEETLFGMGQKEFFVTEKGDVFMRGGGIVSGIGQKMADSLKSDGKGFGSKVWNNTVQQIYGAKWEKIGFLDRLLKKDYDNVMKEFDKQRKEFYDARAELRRSLENDVKNAVAAISERPNEMTRAYSRMKEEGREVAIKDKEAAEKLKSEARDARGGAGRGRQQEKDQRTAEKPKDQKPAEKTSKGRGGWGD